MGEPDSETMRTTVAQVESLTENYDSRIKTAVKNRFDFSQPPKDDNFQLEVITTVAFCFFNEIGGEPKLSHDGSRRIQPLTRTYLNRAVGVASHKDLLDRTERRIEQICIDNQYEGDDKRAQFVEDLMNIKFSLDIRAE